jgi:hypothetical protein
LLAARKLPCGLAPLVAQHGKKIEHLAEVDAAASTAGLPADLEVFLDR